MTQIWKALCSPGAKKEVVTSAPTQVLHRKDSSASSLENVKGLDIKPKRRLLDRSLDATVQASGSGFVFGIILIGLLAWAFLGIPFYDNIDWQVVISDVQAIVSYVFDSLLMRQQLNTHDEGLEIAAQLQSRANSHIRMLQKVDSMLQTGELVQCANNDKTTPDFDSSLPQESRFGHLITRFAVCYGHIVTVLIYWAVIFIWLGFGPANEWSDTWQLWMNSATSALMVFTFAFLANIRERHSTFSKKCIDATFKVDSALERRLRAITGDILENDAVVIAAPKVNFVQRAIYYYADVVGTLVGIALLLIVIVAWIAIGPVLSFNDNWWLIIGTYAGLIGLHDGFILLNVQANLRNHESAQFDDVDKLDIQIFSAAHQPATADKTLPEDSLSFRMSLKMSTAVGKFCAHEIAVLLDLALIIGLLVGSSVMGWNTTGQLLSNVPPSIIESFLMIILIPGHNFADAERRVQVDNYYRRRLQLLAYVDKLSAAGAVEFPKALEVCIDEKASAKLSV